MREEYRRAITEASAMAEQFQTSRSKPIPVDQQLAMWKEECRLIVNKNRVKEDRYASEISTMKIDMSSVALR